MKQNNVARVIKTYKNEDLSKTFVIIITYADMRFGGFYSENYFINWSLQVFCTYSSLLKLNARILNYITSSSDVMIPPGWIPPSLIDDVINGKTISQMLGSLQKYALAPQSWNNIKPTVSEKKKYKYGLTRHHKLGYHGNMV